MYQTTWTWLWPMCLVWSIINKAFFLMANILEGQCAMEYAIHLKDLLGCTYHISAPMHTDVSPQWWRILESYLVPSKIRGQWILLSGMQRSQQKRLMINIIHITPPWGSLGLGKFSVWRGGSCVKGINIHHCFQICLYCCYWWTNKVLKIP